MTDQVIVVMAKAPRAGRVKTRLGAAYPAMRIVDLYRCLLQDTLALACSIADTEVAVMAPPEDLDELAPLLPGGVSGRAQRGTGLADALSSVFEDFAADGLRRVLAFNSDSPHLPPAVLRDAFTALRTHDLVAGPTDDGGYYLVGASAPHPNLFDPSPLGTSGALASLLEHARSQQLTCALTRDWFDVDLASDLARLAQTLAASPAAAPRTAAYLGSWPDRDRWQLPRAPGRSPA